MQVLVIDEFSKARIERLKQYAENNPLTLQDVLDTLEGKKEPIGDNQHHVIFLFNDFRVVYSIEQQPEGTFRHISVSLTDTDKLPSLQAFEFILEAFGMPDTANCVNMWIEGHSSINVLAELDGVY